MSQVAAVAQSPFEVPLDVARTVLSPKSYTDDDVIYPAFKWLRTNLPVGFAQVEGYDPLWIITKHADVMVVERNPNLFHNADFNTILNERASDEFMKSINNGSTRLVSSLVYMDPPEHGLYREIAAKWFLPANIVKLEARIRQLAKTSVEHLLSFDGECDFVKDFALHYPLRVIMTLFGVPPEDEPRMLKLTQELFGVHDPEEQRDEVKPEPDVAGRMWHAALQDFYSYFNVLSRERRERPRDDLLSLIANSKVNGEPIGEAEANGYYVTIATAGHDTTSSTVAGGLLGLIRRPSEFDKVKAEPRLTAGLVDEALRWTTPVKHFMRNATADTELRGQKIRAMDRLMLCYPSANRDEGVFEAPDEFRITRGSNRHLSFGYGPHMCLGMHLAKLEMRILFEELLPRLQAVELAGTPRLVETNFVGGLKSLPIRFQKA